MTLEKLVRKLFSSRKVSQPMKLTCALYCYFYTSISKILACMVKFVYSKFETIKESERKILTISANLFIRVYIYL